MSRRLAVAASQGGTAPKRANGVDGGFTLVELLVVVVVLGILAAIGVPTYLNVRAAGWDAEAMANLRSAMPTARLHFYQHGVYTDDHTVLAAMEPNLSWGDPDASEGGVVAERSMVTVIDDGVDRDGDGSYNCSVSDNNGVVTASGDCAVSDGEMVCLWAASGSGTVYVLVDAAGGAETYYGRGGCPTDEADLGRFSTNGW